MKIISLQQGSQEWLDWRERKITATDASIIMGLNPFKNSNTLWKEKLSIVAAPPANHHMQIGQELEPVARALFIEETGIYVEPLVGQHEELYWMGASFDGIDATRKVLVEIKCPGSDTHLLALDGAIKPYYMAQMQHQMFVSDNTMCYYVSYNTACSPKFTILEVTRNEEFIRDLLPKAKRYFEMNISSFEMPAEPWEFKQRKGG